MKLQEILGLKKPKAKTKEPKKIALNIIILVVVLAVLVLTVAPVFAYEMIYRDKNYMGLFIDGVNIGGLTKQQTIDILNRNFDNIRNSGLTFSYDGQNYNLPITAVSPTDPDLAFEILSLHVDAMADSAFKYGRTGHWYQQTSDQLIAVLSKAQLPLSYNLNEAELTKSLQEKFGSLAKPAHEPSLLFEGSEIKVLPDNDGFDIDYGRAIYDLKQNLNLIGINAVQVNTKLEVAQVRQPEAELLLPQVREILKTGDITLKYQDRSWIIKSEEYKNWLGFKKIDKQVSVWFDPALIGPKLDELAKEIDMAPQEAKFQMADNKVKEFQPALPGLELDKEVSLNNLNREFFINKNKTITLAVKESPPISKTEDTNTLGIKELIGKGVSDFSGSHTNRIKNIKNAVAHLNGLIIPPGEFSIVDAIGEVNAATGYFQEFVIKGDRTIPEYGGGLCQIGTTIFRVALYSGLPITERRPHSYIVSYYKPLGMDATIYGPHPDVRFLNDTGHNILLQIKIEGTKLTFEFWGTSDGRKVEITDPEIYNRTGIPADRLIENPNLKPGEKKKLETGRGGADTHFYRYITKADGAKTEEIFRSHYVPWPNIYEIGVTPKPEVPPADSSAEPSTSDSATAGQSGATNQNTNSAQ